MPNYVELQVTSNFSFLRGAAHPEELAAQAAALGHPAIAITDRNTLAGVVRGHSGTKTAGIRLVVGTRLDLTDGPSVICLPTSRAAYGRLSQLLTLGKRRAEKGECHLNRADLLTGGVFARGAGQILLIIPPGDLDDEFPSFLKELKTKLQSECYLAANHRYGGNDTRRLAQLAELAAAGGTPLVATNDVHYHVPERRALADVVTCIREHCTIDTAGWRLASNAERHLKPAEEMARLFRDYPDAVARTVEIAERCQFSLEELRYDYPIDPIPGGDTPDEALARLAWAGANERYPPEQYPGGIPDTVRKQITHELDLIAELRYAPYFLTVHDIVRFARSQDILCQGRGSAANSAVCYCLGITAVDPARLDLLFERFVSAERNEPPDIDVDFEHERREEVIQYIYEKYGRARAGLAATVVSYRSRSAMREVGKALGLSEDTVGALAGQVWGWSNESPPDEVVRSLGLDPSDPRLAMALELTHELIGFPRHLSQHVGGFVITAGRLDAMVPIENAAMDDRTVIEWDKDDLDAIGILKIDVLALGMLTCVRKGFDLLRAHYGLDLELATVPSEETEVYDMLCRADSLGVFQVESRAQMAFLPRMKPRNFYDLVIEVAIVRPGPIQGDMVHPYLRRRNGEERVTFPSRDLEDVLGKTLGIPLFQEQAMKIAIVAAGFTPNEADGLRRAMATFRKTGTIHTFEEKLIRGMVERGYEADFAERCFRQIEGFGDYGFPESHSASFSLLVYVSAWLKCFYPEVFAAALLNSQPMGFYAPAQIVRDARDHGIEVRSPDINHSQWDYTLEPLEPEFQSPHPEPVEGRGDKSLMLRHANHEGISRQEPSLAWQKKGFKKDELPGGRYALRLGLRQVKGLKEEAGEVIVAARGAGYDSVGELWQRAGVTTAALTALADADAFGSLGFDRREAMWAIRALGHNGRETALELPLFASADDRHATPATDNEPAVSLPVESAGEAVANDYTTLRLSLKNHPLTLLRGVMDNFGVARNETLVDKTDGAPITVAGLVLVRQRPGTASGVIFVTLEDETGVANVIVWPKTFQRFRKIVLSARLLRVDGILQREGIVTHIIANRIVDMSAHLDALGTGELIDPPYANGDEVKSGGGTEGRHPPPRRRLPPPVPARHPRNNHIRIASRDFH